MRGSSAADNPDLGELAAQIQEQLNKVSEQSIDSRPKRPKNRPITRRVKGTSSPEIPHGIGGDERGRGEPTRSGFLPQVFRPDMEGAYGDKPARSPLLSPAPRVGRAASFEAVAQELAQGGAGPVLFGLQATPCCGDDSKLDRRLQRKADG